MGKPLTTSDLIFSSQANHNFSSILSDLKRSTLSITNRLNSIIADAEFVTDVAERLRLPVIANERAGSWYVPPNLRSSKPSESSAYFKSTDGHTGVWKFSTRRLNLHLLSIFGQHGGGIIVDSTRRGKRMPDALSKTIPIWIAVLNRALWPDDLEAGRLRTPGDVVSGSENAMMAERIERFVEDFRALGLDLQDLRRKVGRPMRARWVTPDSDLEDLVGESEEEEGKEGRWNTIYLVTASRCISGTEASAGGYIQGSGDDTENWAHGLTPSIFWENKDVLLETPEAELSGLIERLVMKDGMRKLEVRKGDEGKERFDAVPPTANLRVIAISALRELREDEVRIVLLPTATPSSSWLECGSAETEGDAERKESAESGKKSKVLELGIGTGKLASRALRTALPVVFSFLSFHLTPTLPPTTSTFDPNSPPQGAKPKHITIACPDARDLSVGVALAILCKLYDDSGAMSMEGKAEGKRKVDKLLVKKRLNWITAWKPDANPSRSTLQSVNTVLMGWE